MLNHARRAPPPPPLIRLFNPNGEEGETELDQRSDTASSASSSTTSSQSESLGSFDEYPVPQHRDTVCSGQPYFQMRMKWLQGPASSQYDNLPTSVSSISSQSDLMIPSPTSETSITILEDGESGRLDSAKGIAPWHNMGSRHEGEEEDTRIVLDWLVRLTDMSFKTDGEVLLFFQSEKEPGKQSRVEC